MPNEATRATLIDRIRESGDAGAWRQFDTLYRGLIIRYARIAGFQQADAEDVAQAVLTGFIRALPGFRYDRSKGRFRSYLGRCTRNVMSQWAACPKSARLALATDSGVPLEAAGAAPPEADEAWEREWVAFHYRRAFEEVRRSCDARTMEVFDAIVKGLTVRQAAEQFEMSEDAVYKVVQRTRERLRVLIAAQIHEEDGDD